MVLLLGLEVGLQLLVEALEEDQDDGEAALCIMFYQFILLSFQRSQVDERVDDVGSRDFTSRFACVHERLLPYYIQDINSLKFLKDSTGAYDHEIFVVRDLHRSNIRMWNYQFIGELIQLIEVFRSGFLFRHIGDSIDLAQYSCLWNSHLANEICEFLSFYFLSVALVTVPQHFHQTRSSSQEFQSSLFFKLIAWDRVLIIQAEELMATIG